MEWVETTGRTLEEARDAALDQLGVDEQDAEFEVLEDAKQGLFGRLRSEARVRARVRPTSPPSRDDGRRRRRRSGAGDETLAADPPAPSPERPAALRTEPVPRPTPAREAPSSPKRRVEEVRMDEDVALMDQAGIGREFLAGLLTAFALDGSIDLRERPPGLRPGGDREEIVELAITGTDLGLLIGPQGATLNAVQELTRTVVQRRTGARNGRLIVDVGGYREKRSLALANFVRGIASEVLRTGERTALEAMHAADRKVVHDTVNEIAGVTTMSEGEEPRRRVVLEADKN
ncbi:MAG: protein jag [Acidimicrobiales bacterium]